MPARSQDSAARPVLVAPRARRAWTNRTDYRTTTAAGATVATTSATQPVEVRGAARDWNATVLIADSDMSAAATRLTA